MARKCDFCGARANSKNSVFDVTEEIRDSLKIKEENRKRYKSICERHFYDNAISYGPKRKKLKIGALPHSFENTKFTRLDHTYANFDDAENDEACQNEHEVDENLQSSQSIELQSSEGSLWGLSQEDTIATGNESENDDYYNDEEAESSVYEFECTWISLSSLLFLLSVCRGRG